jgi:hypothetical protein
MEGQTRRQIDKGLKLNLHRFSLAMEITVWDYCPKRGNLDAVSVEDGVGDVAYVNLMHVLDDRDGIQSSWANISVRMLSGLVALLVAELGSFVHLDEGLFRVVEAKFSDEVGEDLVEWPDESGKIWCGFAALGETELMSSEETLTRDSVG